VIVSNRNPAASRVALVASLPDILIFSGVAPSFAFAANFSFAQQALSALRDQSLNQILYDGTPHEKTPAAEIVARFSTPGKFITTMSFGSWVTKVPKKKPWDGKRKPGASFWP